MNALSVCKVDLSQRLVFGWGLVSSENGQPYVDSQGDEITDDVLLPAVTDYMLRSRAGWLEHRPGQIGTVVHSLPLTGELAAAFGIQCSRTGWIIGMRIDDPVILNDFATKKLTGFSIGGRYIIDGGKQ